MPPLPSQPSQLEVSLTHKKIQSLIEEIDQGRIVLPDFQRDFVWPTGQIGSLLESLLNGYYINTLLTLPVVAGDNNTPFPPRQVNGATADAADSGQLDMVLDGQQRITSIYYALTAPNDPLANTKYPQRFGLKFSNIVDGQLDEDTVTWKSTHYGIWNDLSIDDYHIQVEKDFIPFTIFKSNDIFDTWRYGMEDYSSETDSLTIDNIRTFDRQTKVFRNYGIPIIEMGANTSPSTVVQTFERINTQGLELGIFDILTARLYPSGVRLRELWNQTLEEQDHIRGFSNNIGENRLRKHLLKTLALYRNQECKDENVGKLSSSNFRQDWRVASDILNRALEKSRSASTGGFGVTEKYGFPYSTLLPPLANLLYLAEQSETYPRHESLDLVKRWYWASTFSKRYSGSSDTISYKDYTEGRDWIRGDRDAPPEAIAQASNLIPVELDLKTLTRGGPYAGIMSLLVLNDARDFNTFESITVHEVDDHHIFPESQLRNGATGTTYDETARNRILNRTVIEWQNNRFNIRDRLPSDYIPDMISEHPDGESGIRELLRSHFINDRGFEALLNDEYDVFCQERKREIQLEIEQRVDMPIKWEVSEEAL